MPRLSILLLFLATLFMEGCSTIVSKQEGRWGESYSGLNYSLERWPEYYHACIFAPPLLLAVIPASAIDIPLSAIADTIILPVDLIIQKGSPARIDEEASQ